ncbi:hypothetical protein CYMTET_13144 [Cymbomonas tetramitiformis]|uniref:Uncharacterized protein n=1 Tax=Cymbomonas tetramitiformis TaxID=36881 RepID=A0AAE0GIY0_9CHLO|nr:hypothetical protein CYMTET_13144 [Cymbomonas tetramitiformis]
MKMVESDVPGNVEHQVKEFIATLTAKGLLANIIGENSTLFNFNEFFNSEDPWDSDLCEELRRASISQNFPAAEQTPEVLPSETLPYRLEWWHDCLNTHCSSAEDCKLCQTRRHICGPANGSPSPPPVPPYGSAYWMNRKGPPTSEVVNRRSSMTYHLRARCGAPVFVRIIDVATGEPAPNNLMTEHLQLEANLLGPYSAGNMSSESTFSKVEWTEDEYERSPTPSTNLMGLMPFCTGHPASKLQS